MNISFEIGMVNTIFRDYVEDFKESNAENPIGQAIGITLTDFKEVYYRNPIMEFAILITIHSCVESLDDEKLETHLDYLGERIDKLALHIDSQ